ncbi:MAG: ankyrin repeat domain-containing protein [Pandoraea sp.]|nr:ankyrin repeat domain-containing protein [Pandoraea sp.]MDR3397084.1 ankyrin repeat domain-containing protein [Pandoraea sp.]
MNAEHTLRLHRNILMGVVLLIISMLAGCGQLVVAGRSAQEAFHDEGVVNLLKAAKRNDAEEAKRLIEGGVNVNAVGKDGATPLIWMFGLQDLRAMRLLLDLGANPNQYVVGGVSPPVKLAAGGGKLEALRLLLDHGADPNVVYGNRTPLMMAIQGSHIDCAELLLQYGADINLSHGPLSALTEAVVHVQFGDALWVLNHGYTHDLPMARRMLNMKTPRPGQEELKVKALEIVDRLLAQQERR